MMLLKSVIFERFARKRKISDAVLWEAIKRAETGLIDADLGGGVIKQRVAREGEGKRGAFRTIVIFRSGERAFFVYGFAKSKQANIQQDEKAALKKLAPYLLNMPDEKLNALIADGSYMEVTENGPTV